MRTRTRTTALSALAVAALAPLTAGLTATPAHAATPAVTPAGTSTAAPMAGQIGPWEPSVTRDSMDGDPGGVSGTARLQRFNTASPSGIEFAEITFTAAGERVKVRDGSPWNAHWYLTKNGAVRNSGTVSAGNTVKKNFNIREGERIGIKLCLYWAGGSKCVENGSLKS
ncbi:hypothetical protein [Actinomadura verrucosospora]|uniref:Uncharacterized protein n=1 Tax=Actinomadura verrucosospora TaxID=46165 RepID=A0A7D3VTW1_ACTVE|nr:hypothetical protein [Actinomadura verrucosospora]QKG19131.1 hypothetical protein ACTIVE_0767 [Actinomadura verrucosospora]